MTTTPELHELATDPQAFDTELARLHTEIAKATSLLQYRMDLGHRAVGDRKRWVGRSQAWTRRWDDVHADLLVSADAGDEAHRTLLDKFYAVQAAWRELENKIQAMDRHYAAQAKPWTRFFPSVTKSQPHIHRSLSCRTLHPTTQMSWAPQLSGKTDEVAVAELDEALCSVCFPDAPVALHNYQSKRSQAERDERQAAKDERDAKKAAKTLTEAEQFRTAGRFSARITTVAACKELVRKAVEAAIEYEWIMQPERVGDRGMDPEMVARMRANRAQRMEEAYADAQQAMTVLMAREAAHEGWGATAEAITKMQASKEKSTRKEYGL